MLHWKQNLLNLQSSQMDSLILQFVHTSSYAKCWVWFFLHSLPNNTALVVRIMWLLTHASTHLLICLGMHWSRVSSMPGKAGKQSIFREKAGWKSIWLMEQWPSGYGAGFSIQRSQVQNYWVTPRLTQFFIQQGWSNEYQEFLGT